jgi:hypothetical protein
MFLYIDAAGCPDTCRHCAVDGHQPYGALFSPDALRTLKKEWGPLTILYEPTAHPDFPEIYQEDIAEPHGGWLVTNGFGLARRDDHEQVFAGMRTMGMHTIVHTLHGLRDHHDWFVCRKGAFDDILLATRRARERGFTVYWQIYADAKGAGDIPALVELANREASELQFMGNVYHRVGGRLWHYEKIRLTAREVETYGLHQIVDDPQRNQFTAYESLTARAWLDKWREAPTLDEFRHPFEPLAWPPSPDRGHLSLQMDRHQKVYLLPFCAPPIFPGHASEGREILLERLARLPRPAFVALTPDEIQLTPEEEGKIHPTGYSFRYLEIAKRRMAKN